MKDSLFFKCMLVSGVLHAVAMVLFFNTPVHFHPTFFTHLGKTPSIQVDEEELVILRKDRALADAFREFVVASPTSLVQAVAQEPAPPQVEERSVTVSDFLLLPETPDIASPSSPPVAPLETPSIEMSPSLAPSSLAVTLPDPEIEQQQLENPFITLQSAPTYHPMTSETKVDFDYLPSQEQFAEIKPPMPLIPSSHAAIETEFSILSKKDLPPPQNQPLQEIPLPAKQVVFNPSITLAPHYPLQSLSTYGLPDFKTADWNDFFDIDIKTVAREEGGYLFSLTLLPKADLSPYRLKQNYYFIIDRSNSIEKTHYSTFKRAVARALGSLREDDRFNVMILDSKVTRLNESALPYNKKSQRLAEEFLERQPHGYYGTAPTNMLTSLEKIIPGYLNEDETCTAILISDGNTTLKPEAQRNLINSWMRANNNKITLYTAAVGQGNNLSLLDLLGTVGRGSLLYSDTHTAFARKLAKLVLTIRSPIGREMSFSIVPSDPSSRIQLFPSSARLPYLFSDHPFVFFGTADKLSDFNLILEGRNKDQTIKIQKTVSFAKAKPGNRLLVKEWPAQQAHLFYDQFLKEGKAALLEEAKKLLSDELENPRR